jgi:hypothetical protein
MHIDGGGRGVGGVDGLRFENFGDKNNIKIQKKGAP